MLGVSRIAAVAAATATLSACGAQADVLGQASRSLGNVRSGNMDLRMAVGTGDPAADVGFEERGPFSLPNAGALPVARTEVLHFVGDKREGNTLISTGKNVYLDAGGQAYQLPPASVDRLRRASSAGGSLGALDLSRWASGTSVSDGGEVDGVATDRVAGAVNVGRFVNDVMQLSQGLGQSAAVPQLSPADGAELARAVRSSRFELWAGRGDHLPRRLSVRVDFSAPAGAPASAAVARYSQSRLQLDLALSNVNHAVVVADPPGAQPFSAYCGRQPDAPACAAATP